MPAGKILIKKVRDIIDELLQLPPKLLSKVIYKLPRDERIDISRAIDLTKDTLTDEELELWALATYDDPNINIPGGKRLGWRGKKLPPKKFSPMPLDNDLLKSDEVLKAEAEKKRKNEG